MRRLFIALLLPDEVKEALGAVQVNLKRILYPRLKWVQPEGMHLTLKFVGDFPFREVERLQEALRSVAAQIKHTTQKLRLDGVGAFPNLEEARVLWVGLQGGLEALSGLARAVDAVTCKLGLPAEKRRFDPHITLARSGRQQYLDLHQAASCQVRPVTFEMSSFALMESHLERTGASYEEVCCFKLG